MAYYKLDNFEKVIITIAGAFNSPLIDSLIFYLLHPHQQSYKILIYKEL